MKKLLSFLFALMLLSVPFVGESKAESVIQMKYTAEMPDITREGLYSGEVENGIPHGYGLFTAINSEGIPWHYIGQWKNGKMCGEGGTYWDSGQSNVGLFEANSIICGTIHTSTSNNYWIDQRPNEHGCCDIIQYFEDGSVMFEGCMDAKTGLYHRGTVYQTDGTVYYSGNMNGMSPNLSYTANIAGMTYTELLDLKDQINLAIWNSEEWQEVEVPQGVWIVGEDIPAGKWTIKSADGIKTAVEWGDRLNEAGTSLSWIGNVCEFQTIYSTSYRNYEKGDPTEVTWNLKDGQYFIVDSGIAVFSAYSGKPSLGFK